MTGSRHHEVHVSIAGRSLQKEAGPDMGLNQDALEAEPRRETDVHWDH
jgi:hypothetical protein